MSIFIWRFLRFAVIAGVLAAGECLAQDLTVSNNRGVNPYETYGGSRENINLATGNVNVPIRLLTLPGRAGHDLVLGLAFDTKIWQLQGQIDSITGSWNYWWDLTGGWSGMVPWLNTSTVAAASNVACTGGYLLNLPDGSKHSFSTVRSDCIYTIGSQQGQRATAYDIPIGGARGAVYSQLDASNPTLKVVTLKNGTKIQFDWTGGGTKVIDTNGNTILYQYVQGNEVITDTLGRVVTLLNYVNSTPTGIRYKDSNGVDQTITLTWLTATLSPSFLQPPNTPLGCYPCTPAMYELTSIVYPNGLTYTFQYDNFGELTKITYPPGGYSRYDYGAFVHWESALFTSADFREVTAKHVCSAASGSCSTEDNTTYTPTINSTLNNNQYVDQVDPLNNLTHFEFSLGGGLAKYYSPRELNRYVYQGTTTLLRTIHTDYNNLLGSSPQDNSLPIRVTTTLNDTNQVSKVENDYDNLGAIDNVIEHREYDFGAGAPGLLVRRTDNTWLKTNSVNGVDYTSTALYILDRKASETIYDGSGVQAQSLFEYDSFTEGITASGAVQHNLSYGTGYTTRGNLTAAQRWRNTDGAWLTTRNQYDDAGSVRKITDPLSHSTTFSYSDSWGNATCLPAGGSAAAYRTSTTNALSQVNRSTYNSCTGTVASTTDANNQTTTFSYDLMGRPVQTNLPDGGQTTITYNEASKPLSVATTAKITTSVNKVVTIVVEGLGRIVQSQFNSDLQGVVYTDTTYDALGRKSTVSNSYRSTLDSTYGITTTQYDALSRVSLLVPPDGTSTSNNVTTAYSGNCTTVTDQAGKKRKSCSDALGRLTQVFEPDANGNLVNETDYQYDVLGNLTCAVQRGTDTTSFTTCAAAPAAWHPRSFVYNSLSQLLTATNPESGTITYTYDNDGNLLTKTAPAPNQTGTTTVTTTYTYDALNRLTQKSYSDATPPVKYGYDGVAPTGCTPPTLTITNGIGRRTSMCDAAGAEAWTYDVMGRVLADQRTISGVTKTASYTYNLDGSVATLAYPSGRTITYTPSAAGRTVSAVDTTNSTSPINYATGALYAPQGALASLINGGSIASTFYYNSRLQPCRISVKGAGTAPAQCSDAVNVGNVLDLNYGFNLGTANNGNVASITNNLNTARSQTFGYDQLNRIATAQTSSTSGPNCWGEQFSYDIWGNLLSIGGVIGYTGCTQQSLSVTALANNQLSGYGYDAAGNMTNYPSLSTYTYNAENQLTSTAGVTYTYDGDGKRVQKSSGKLYWYGLGSDPLDETDLTGSAANVSFNEYIFFGGKRIARRDSSNNVFYYFADHLATARVVTNAAGTVLDDSDFYPFGGERPAITPTSGNNYKFTGKERDSESGLDNFGARYDASSLGRFMTPDSTGYSSLANPQAWNLYAYTLNNPLKYNDPTGHTVECTTNALQCKDAIADATANAEAAKRVTTQTRTTQHKFLLFHWTTTKTTIQITGDINSFRALGQNASRLADLVTDKRTFTFAVSPTYTSFGGAERVTPGGMTQTPSQGFSLPSGVSGAVTVNPNPGPFDQDTLGLLGGEVGPIPGANVPETAAHELLGHLWGEYFGGHAPRTTANKQDAVVAENAVRATDPTRGQKVTHGGEQVIPTPPRQ